MSLSWERESCLLRTNCVQFSHDLGDRSSTSVRNLANRADQTWYLSRDFVIAVFEAKKIRHICSFATKVRKYINLHVLCCFLENDIKLHKIWQIKYQQESIHDMFHFWTCILIYHSKVLKIVKKVWNCKQCKYHLDCGLLGVAKNRQGILCYYFQTFVRVYLAKTLVCTICYQYNPIVSFHLHRMLGVLRRSPSPLMNGPSLEQTKFMAKFLLTAIIC